MIHCDNTGKPSMMRVGFAVSLLIGSILCIAGAAAVFLGLESNGLLTSGSLMITGSGFAKSIQKKYES